MLPITLAAFLAFVSLGAARVPSPQQVGTISILAVDDLITNDYKTTSAALLLNTPECYSTAARSCQLLGESLWAPAAQDFQAGLNQSLAYEVYARHIQSSQLLWIHQNVAAGFRGAPCQALDVKGTIHQVNCAAELPALCTQSAPASNITYADTSARFQVAQRVGRQTLVGYRDFLTFRYMGVRFAKEPERFTYSSLYEGTGTNNALNPAPECLQLPNNGSTDCLFMNIFTTTLPSAPRPKSLKPVMVYIYGGGFTSGSASNPTNDGGNLAARGDVVTVDLAYRLSTLGFLPFNDGVHNGSYWMSDLVAGLQWIQKYITSFGGDPERVTIFGESAGAVSVQDLIESPQAAGLFRGAILQSDYHQPSVSIEYAYNRSTIPILNETGCLSASNQLACLQAYPAIELLNLSTIANYPIIDGKYLTSAYLNVDAADANATNNKVALMIGVNRDEAGVLDPIYPTSDLNTGISDVARANGLNATALISSGLFPLGSGPEPANQTLNVFNTTTRINTDNSFRCSSQQIAAAGVKNQLFTQVYMYELNRTYQDPGYDSNHVCGAPVTATHPFGDPSGEYFKCHAGDLAYTFGNVARVGFPLRDENDKPFMQLVTDYWTSFARNLNPNPDMGYLQARGYWSTINQVAVSGSWEEVDPANPKLLELQWNSFMMPFRDQEQCALLGYPLPG